MEGVDESTFAAQILLALVAEVAVDEDKGAGLHLFDLILFFLLSYSFIFYRATLRKCFSSSQVSNSLRFAASSPRQPTSEANWVPVTGSKVVPPSSFLTKRLLTGDLLCEPFANDRVPFVTVASSSAIQNPTALGGLVYKNVLSWCGGTAPPISGCLQITMLCKTLGSLKPIDFAIDLCNSENVAAWNFGESSWR